MNKNGQKCTSNLQMPIFAITDDRKALRSIFRIFILYAGQHSCMYESSCLFSLDSFGKEIKRPSASGNILALEYCGQIFCVPLGLTEKDKVEITIKPRECSVIHIYSGNNSGIAGELSITEINRAK